MPVIVEVKVAPADRLLHAGQGAVRIVAEVGDVPLRVKLFRQFSAVIKDVGSLIGRGQGVNVLVRKHFRSHQIAVNARRGAEFALDVLKLQRRAVERLEDHYRSSRIIKTAEIKPQIVVVRPAHPKGGSDEVKVREGAALQAIVRPGQPQRVAHRGDRRRALFIVVVAIGGVDGTAHLLVFAVNAAEWTLPDQVILVQIAAEKEIGKFLPFIRPVLAGHFKAGDARIDHGQAVAGVHVNIPAAHFDLILLHITELKQPGRGLGLAVKGGLQ